MSASANTDRGLLRTMGPWLLVLAVALVPRLITLDADTPAALGSAFFTDEGWWAHNARQRALFGHWVMDEQNLALYATPAYTVALAGVYKLLGVGFFQTRLLSALAGALTCVLVYGFLRKRHPSLALTASLLLGSSYTMLAHNRVGLTESFQLLFLTLTALCIVRSLHYPRWGAAAGVFLVLSVLAKTSSIILLVVLPVFWLVHWRVSRRGFTPAFSWSGMLHFTGAAALAGSILLVAVILPHWSQVGNYLLSPVRSAAGALITDRISLFGLPGGLAINQFYVTTAVLLIAVVLLAVQRLGQGKASELNEVELFAWVWLVVTLGCLSAVSYQPHRRFLLLMPPLAILAATAFQERAIRIPGPQFWNARPRWIRVLAMSVLAGAVGYYATVGLTPLTTKLTAGVSFGDEPGLPASLIRLGLWHGVFCLALLGGLLGLRRLPAGGLAIPTILLIVAFGLAEPARYAVHLSQPHYTVRDASRAIAVYAREQGIDRGTILGNTADTFAQETELFAFTIRRWKERNSYMNLDGYARFKPDFVLEMRRTAEFPLELVEQKQPHLRLVKSWDIGPPERRQMGQIGLYQVVGSPPLGAEEEPQSGVID